MTVTQFINTNTGNAVKNHFVITDGNKTTFQSYNSTIAEIKQDEHGNKILTVYPEWNYSITTSKHFCNWLLQNLNVAVKKPQFEKILKNGYIGYESGYSVRVYEA